MHKIRHSLGIVYNDILIILWVQAEPLTAATALPAPSPTPLTPALTTLAPCLIAVLPNDNKSNTAGVGVNRARLCVMGDMGGLVTFPFLRLVIAGLTIADATTLSSFVMGGDDLRLMMTGNNVKPVRKTSLAIKTGSRKSEVKLSPCILSSSIPSAVLGKASLERMLPTDAVT